MLTPTATQEQGRTQNTKDAGAGFRNAGNTEGPIVDVRGHARGRIGRVVVEADNRDDRGQRLPVASIDGQSPGQGDGLPRVQSETVPSAEHLIVVRIRTVPSKDDPKSVGRRVGRGGRDVDIEGCGEGIRPRGRLRRDCEAIDLGAHFAPASAGRNIRRADIAMAGGSWVTCRGSEGDVSVPGVERIRSSAEGVITENE